MTNGNSDGLAQIEQLLQRSIQASDERMTRIEQSVGQLTQSNARAIQALTEEARQERQELRQAMIRLADAQAGIANLVSSLDGDRPTILRKLSTIENKIDRLLDGDKP